MLDFLPLKIDVETKPVLRKAAVAHKALAELKGVVTNIPNENILLETLTLREARESSAIENIISTFDEVYQSNLFSNDDMVMDADPLIKMAIIHHQFESIHPFYDGNGRTGRIINILYLVKMGLLDLPVLYLSRYIIKHKAAYYRLLQEVREKGDWE